MEIHCFVKSPKFQGQLVHCSGEVTRILSPVSLVFVSALSALFASSAPSTHLTNLANSMERILLFPESFSSKSSGFGKARVGARHYGRGGEDAFPCLLHRGQTIHNPHRLKLKAGQFPKGNGVGVGKGGWGAATQQRRHACPAGNSHS